MKSRRQIWLLRSGLLGLGLMAVLPWRGFLGRSSNAPEQKALFYQDSMHPWVKSDQPGKCTICSMDLTPIYEGQTGFGLSNNLVVLSSNSITVLNVQASEVKRQPLRSTLRVAGTLEANETRKTILSAPAACQIQAMTVGYAGVEVEKGQSLISLFSPELVQKAGYFRGTTASSQYSPIGLEPPKDKANPYSRELAAPQSGVVVERNAYVGQYVAEGEKLLTIVDASVLWFRFDVYERQLPWLQIGQKIDVVVPAIPGKVFPAVIAFIEPTLNEVTRTVKVRADIKNPVVASQGGAHRLLRFGMYAEGRVRAEVPDVLAVPRTAVLFPGGAAYAYVDRGNGAYERRRVTLGRQGDELWEILGGLEDGDPVVTAGNTLMDAQAQFNHEGELEDVADLEMTSVEPAVLPEPVTGSMEHASTASGTAMLEPDDDRQAAPQGGMAEPHTGAASTPSVLPGMGTHAMPSAAAHGVPDGDGAQPSTNRPLSRAALSVARVAYKDEMWRNRMALIAAAHEQKTANATSSPATNEQRATNAASPTADQRQALQAFLAVAAKLSAALAADDLATVNQWVTNLPSVLLPLQKAMVAGHPYSGPIQRLASLPWRPSQNLATAREQFLPFSTATVELAKGLRKEDRAFAGLKIYHCPMAPKPGLWMQSKGPLANPFYGAKMLTCGEEVKP